MKNYRREMIDKLEGEGRIYEEELLNMLLSNAYGGKDFTALSKALLARFPGVRAIIEASFEEIMTVEGVTESIATYFKTLELLQRTEDRREVYIKNTEQAFVLAERRLGGKDSEYAELYFVNARGLVVEVKSFTSHKANRVDVEASKLLATVSVPKSQSLYFVHNHINCHALPSSNDDAATQRIMLACNLNGVKFIDHIIVSAFGDRFSYLQSGRLDEIKRSAGID